MQPTKNQGNFSEEDKKGSTLDKNVYLEYTHSGKIWRSCPTAGEGDCFFHSVFGTKDNDGLYRDRRAKSRRMTWSAFLFHHSCGSPTGALLDVLNRCFAANDRRIDNPDDFTDYASAVADSGYWVLVEEFPILATLENVKIVLFGDAGADPMVFVPNLELLGDFPSRNISEIRVAICLADGHFSRLNKFEEPIVTSLVHKLNSVNEEVTAIQMPQNASTVNHKKHYPKLGSAGMHGIEYQIKLLTMVLLNAMKKVKNWRLSTEHKEAPQFDDLIFEFPSESAILLQAKHKEDENKEVTLKDLLSVNKKEFSLPTYFLSYQEAKKNFQVRNIIICTNLRIDNKTKDILKKESVDPDNVLHFEGAENICYGFSGCPLPQLKQEIKKYHTENVKNLAISDEDINEYLKHLKFFPYCLNDKNVDRIMLQTISQIELSENLSSEWVQKDILTKMRNWFQEKRGRYLTEVEAKAFFCDMRSQKYCEELQQYDISFKHHNLPFVLQKQQKNENKGKKSQQENDNDAPAKDPKRISHVIPNKQYMLNVVKIYQALPTHHRDTTLFVNPKEPLEVQRQIIDAFEVEHYTILVMVCPDNKTRVDEAKEVCDKVMKILNTRKYKHVILIAEEKNNLANQLKQGNSSYCEDITDVIKFADLEESTQEAFKRKKLINFQGRDMSLSELFTSSTKEDLNHNVSSELLVKLATGEKYVIGQKLPHPDNYYIPRSFNRKGKNLSEEELWRSTEENAVLIPDLAGMGKSFVLTSLASSIKRDNPHLWVIRVDLNKYTNFMQTALKAGRKSVSIIELLNSQETSSIQDEFGRNLFNTSKRVVLMLDAVDEISPTYTDLVVNLIKDSLVQNLVKMFVTTRPHVCESFKGISELHSYTLEPFSKLNQIHFLRNYWITTLDLRDEVKKSKCEIYAKVLIEKVFEWLNEGYRNNFAGIPLQTRMLAEVFRKKNQTNNDEHEWEECNEFLSSDNKEPKLPRRISLAQLYEMFINKKYDIYFEKNNPTGHPGSDSGLRRELLECQKYHCALALEEIFYLDDWQLFTCYTNVKWPIPSNIRDDVLFRVGIVQGKGENIEFLHRTFAEFFVADCIMIELERQSVSEEFQRFLLEFILLDSGYMVIRAFLDSRMRNKLHLFENIICSYFNRNRISEELLTRYFVAYAHEGCAGIFECLIRCIDKGQYYLLSDAFNVNNDFLKYGALQSAIRYGDLNILKLLLELDETFNKGTNAHKQFLVFIVTYSLIYHSETFRFLSRQVDESDKNISVYSIPQSHAFLGRFGEVELWMEKAGVGYVKDNICGSTELRGAVSMSQLEAVKFVTEQIAADINYKNYRGGTALHEAAANGNLEIMKYLVEAAGADVEIKDNYGSTALLYAAEDGNLEIIKYLVEAAGADIEIKDNSGSTALFYAARHGYLEIFKYLVEAAGADTKIKYYSGKTALLYAARTSNLEIIKYLVEAAGADTNIKDNSGSTALLYAARYGKLEIVKYLVEAAGADTNIKDNSGSTALLYAARFGKLEIVKCLVEAAGADTNIKDDSGWTALHRAALYGKLETVKYLVEAAGADIEIKDDIGSTPLHSAVIFGYLEIIKYLVEAAGADVEIKDNHGSTALLYAAEFGKLEIIKYLVEAAGADIEIKDDSGWTALHHAALYGNLEIVKYLVEKTGANKDITNNQGRTAVQEAEDNGHWSVVQFLSNLSR